MFTADEGYYFGLGAFETIAVEEGKPVFLEEHYQRLLQALQFFELQVDFEKIQQKVQEALGEEPGENREKGAENHGFPEKYGSEHKGKYL